MNLNDKKQLQRFREMLEDEIRHDNECLRRTNTKEDDIVFWKGASIQAKSILFYFNMIFEKQS